MLGCFAAMDSPRVQPLGHLPETRQSRPPGSNASTTPVRGHRNCAAVSPGQSRHRFQSLHRRCPVAACADLSPNIASASARMFNGVASGRACQSGSEVNTAAMQSEVVSPPKSSAARAIQTKRSRKPKCRCACPQASHGLVPGSCIPGVPNTLPTSVPDVVTVS